MYLAAGINGKLIILCIPVETAVDVRHMKMNIEGIMTLMHLSVETLTAEPISAGYLMQI